MIENGVIIAPQNPTPEQVKVVEDSKIKDLKVKNYLSQSIDRSIMETILAHNTSKDISDSLKKKFWGSTKVKRAQLQALCAKFEALSMKEDECVNIYFAIANKMTCTWRKKGGNTDCWKETKNQSVF